MDCQLLDVAVAVAAGEGQVGTLDADDACEAEGLGDVTDLDHVEHHRRDHARRPRPHPACEWLDALGAQRAPLAPLLAVAKVELVDRHRREVLLSLSCREEERSGRNDMRWRIATLHAGARELREHWDFQVAAHGFTKPWPPAPAEVLDELAQSAAEVDDGRGRDDWLLSRPPEEREGLIARLGEEELDDTLEHQRGRAWRLYRLLGPEVYEPLVARHRRWVAVLRFQQRSEAERSAEHADRLARAGDRMKERRGRAGLNRSAAAQLLGMSSRRLGAIERGATPLTAAELLAVCELYDISPGRLLA